jgi:rubrerythrin
MTEYNLFCYSKSFNDSNSFQKERYRAFNKVVGEKRYNEILKLVNEIIPQEQLTFSESFKTITQTQWSQLLAIPEASDFKEGFEYISDCKIDDVNLKKNDLLKKADELIEKANELKQQANSL